MEKKKVFVGLSGGVDSAVSAALLKRQGYDVVGVFIKTWHPEGFPCTEPDDRRSAMRVAAHLGIPFMTLDLSKEYKEGVADVVIDAYRKGLTPNPDVLCNRQVKFGGLLSFALKEGAEYIATGHYARVREGFLYAGKDPQKDQSYFLWMLPKEVLGRVLFPLGEFHKSDVRGMAETFRLPNAKRPDSQGICFLGDISMKEFLKSVIDVEPGDVLNETGDVVGAHDGALLYTIGERHGFTSHAGVPLYVTHKNIENNTITVSSSPVQAAHAGDSYLLKETNWFEEPRNGIYMGRYRYRQPLQSFTVEKRGNFFEVKCEEPQHLPLGQSLVLYEGERVLGGGIVDNAL